MKLTLKGTSDYLGKEYQNKLVIKENDKIYFCYHDVDGIEKNTMRLDNCQYTVKYRTGKDHTGASYEIVEFETDQWYYSTSIIQRNKYLRPTFSIQTWNRQEVFLWMQTNHKGHGRGKHWYPDSSDVDTAIILLDNASRKLLSDYIDHIRDTSVSS